MRSDRSELLLIFRAGDFLSSGSELSGSQSDPIWIREICRDYSVTSKRSN